MQLSVEVTADVEPLLYAAPASATGALCRVAFDLSVAQGSRGPQTQHTTSANPDRTVVRVDMDSCRSDRPVARRDHRQSRVQKVRGDVSSMSNVTSAGNARGGRVSTPATTTAQRAADRLSTPHQRPASTNASGSNGAGARLLRSPRESSITKTPSVTLVYYCLFADDVVQTYEGYFRDAFALAKFALDRTHRPTDTVITGVAKLTEGKGLLSDDAYGGDALVKIAGLYSLSAETIRSLNDSHNRPHRPSGSKAHQSSSTREQLIEDEDEDDGIYNDDDEWDDDNYGMLNTHRSRKASAKGKRDAGATPPLAPTSPRTTTGTGVTTGSDEKDIVLNVHRKFCLVATVFPAGTTPTTAAIGPCHPDSPILPSQLPGGPPHLSFRRQSNITIASADASARAIRFGRDPPGANRLPKVWVFPVDPQLPDVVGDEATAHVVRRSFAAARRSSGLTPTPRSPRQVQVSAPGSHPLDATHSDRMKLSSRSAGGGRHGEKEEEVHIAGVDAATAAQLAALAGGGRPPPSPSIESSIAVPSPLRSPKGRHFSTHRGVDAQSAGSAGGKHPLLHSKVERLVHKYLGLYSPQQTRDLAMHYYRFLVASASDRRVCTLQASKLSVNIKLQHGLKSVQLDAFMAFLHDAQKIVELHRRPVRHGATGGAPTPPLRARTGGLRPAPVVPTGPFDPVPPEELLEIIADLSADIPSPEAYPSRSVYTPWTIDWFSYLLLATAERPLWRELFRPLLTRWHYFPGDRSDVFGRMEFMTQLPDIQQILEDDSVSLFYLIATHQARRPPLPIEETLTPARAILSLVPIRFQHLALLHVGENDLPLIATRAAATRQFQALSLSTEIGAEASLSLCVDMFAVWRHFAALRKEQKRRNVMLKAALEKRMHTGSLKLRYFVKWMNWSVKRRALLHGFPTSSSRRTSSAMETTGRTSV